MMSVTVKIPFWHFGNIFVLEGMFKIYIYLLFVTGKMWLKISTNKKFVYSGNIFPKMPIMKQSKKIPKKLPKLKPL